MPRLRRRRTHNPPPAPRRPAADVLTGLAAGLALAPSAATAASAAPPAPEATATPPPAIEALASAEAAGALPAEAAAALIEVAQAAPPSDAPQRAGAAARGGSGLVLPLDAPLAPPPLPPSEVSARAEAVVLPAAEVDAPETAVAAPGAPETALPAVTPPTLPPAYRPPALPAEPPLPDEAPTPATPSPLQLIRQVSGFGPTNRLIGSDANDLMDGAGGADTIWGASGDDGLLGRGGDDLLMGGAGSDGLSGQAGDDLLFGGPGDDLLYGDTDADTLLGGEGRDFLGNGLGDDLMFGGPGADTFRFDFPPPVTTALRQGYDTIADYDPFVDRLDFGPYVSEVTIRAINGEDALVTFRDLQGRLLPDSALLHGAVLPDGTLAVGWVEAPGARLVLAGLSGVQQPAGARYILDTLVVDGVAQPATGSAFDFTPYVFVFP